MAEPSVAEWAYRAAEALSVADTIRDPNAKRVMLEIAAGYQKLAEHVAARDQRDERWLKQPPIS